MKNRDLVNLLNRAAAGLEHLVSITEKERDELVEDLLQAAVEVDRDSEFNAAEMARQNDPVEIEKSRRG